MEKVFCHFGYNDYMPFTTPYDLSMILMKNQRIMRDEIRYSQIIDSFIYLGSATRPNSFAVSKVSQFVLDLRDDH